MAARGNPCCLFKLNSPLPAYNGDVGDLGEEEEAAKEDEEEKEDKEEGKEEEGGREEEKEFVLWAERDGVVVA